MLAFTSVPLWFAISQKVESFSLAGLWNSSRTVCVLLADNSKSSGVCVLLTTQLPHPISRRGRESHLASKQRWINISRLKIIPWNSLKFWRNSGWNGSEQNLAVLKTKKTIYDLMTDNDTDGCCVEQIMTHWFLVLCMCNDLEVLLRGTF